MFAAILALHLFAETQEAKARLAAPPHRGGKVVRAMKYTASGLAGGLVSSAGGGSASAGQRLGTLAFHAEQLGYGYDRGLVVRVANVFDLGGDLHGFHGGLAGDVTGGWRFGASDVHGPFVRGGIAVALRGDALFYQSQVELPQAQIGWQWVTENTALDIAPRAGFVLLGRSRAADDATRTLDLSLDAGAVAALRLGAMFARASWSRFFPRDGGAPVDWIGLGFCGRTRVVLCTTGAIVAGDPRAPHVAEIAVTIGIGDR